MIVAIKKPTGPTSHDIVDAVRRITGEQKVGHAGTLDPLASGVLVVGIGREATRMLGSIVKDKKEYTAQIHLGAESTTDDAEGTVRERVVKDTPDDDTVRKVLQRFVGTVSQVPPRYSAVKVRGKPAHRRMRAGEDVTLSPRTVTVYDIARIQYEWPELVIKTTTGPGVYIRALARDIGEALGTGGYLVFLERTRVGSYTLADALTLKAFEEMWRKK